MSGKVVASPAAKTSGRAGHAAVGVDRDEPCGACRQAARSPGRRSRGSAITRSAGTGAPTSSSSAPGTRGRAPRAGAQRDPALGEQLGHGAPASGPKTHSGSGSGVTTVISGSAPRSRSSTAAMIASSYDRQRPARGRRQHERQPARLLERARRRAGASAGPRERDRAGDAPAAGARRRRPAACRSAIGAPSRVDGDGASGSTCASVPGASRSGAWRRIASNGSGPGRPEAERRRDGRGARASGSSSGASSVMRGSGTGERAQRGHRLDGGDTAARDDDVRGLTSHGAKVRIDGDAAIRSPPAHGTGNSEDSRQARPDHDPPG